MSFLTIEQAADLLGITEDNLMNLVRKKRVPAYKLAGQEIRFKSEELSQLKDEFFVRESQKVSRAGGVEAFMRFNSSYLFLTLFSVALGVLIVKFILT